MHICYRPYATSSDLSQLGMHVEVWTALARWFSEYLAVNAAVAS